MDSISHSLAISAGSYWNLTRTVLVVDICFSDSRGIIEDPILNSFTLASNVGIGSSRSQILERNYVLCEGLRLIVKTIHDGLTEDDWNVVVCIGATLSVQQHFVVYN